MTRKRLAITVTALVFGTLLATADAARGGGGGGGGGGGKPVKAPTVTATNPANNATGVALTTPITATFSKEMNGPTVESSFFVSTSAGAVAGTVSYDTSGTRKATFTSSQMLAEGTRYTATITTGAKDTGGTPLAANYTWSFTTLVIPPPTVSSTDPRDGATNVPVSSVVTATFSKDMDAASVQSTFGLWSASGEVPATVVYADRVATLTPDSPLQSGRTYTAQFSCCAMDTDGKTLGEYSWSFTTETLAAQPIGQGSFPTIAVDRDGNAIALWYSGETLYAKRYTPANGWDAGAAALGTTEGRQRGPAVAMEPDGDAVAVWITPFSAVTPQFLMWSHYDAATGRWSEAAQIGPGEPGDFGTRPYMDFALNASGNGHVVWTDDTGLYVYAASYAADAGFGPPQIIRETALPAGFAPVEGPADEVRAPDVAVNERGDAVATWFEWRCCSFTGINQRIIVAAVYTEAWGWLPAEGVALNEYAIPKAAINGDGGVLVAVGGDHQCNGWPCVGLYSDNIVAYRYPSGEWRDEWMQLGTGTYPFVVAGEDGDALALWGGFEQAEVLASRFTYDYFTPGVWVTELLSVGSNWPASRDLAGSPGGEAVAAFIYNGRANARRFDGAAWGPTRTYTAITGFGFPRVAIATTMEPGAPAFITYVDPSTSPGTIYAAPVE